MRTIIILALITTACDDGTEGGEPDRSGYTPEDYIPEGIDLADYDTEAKRICLLYAAVTQQRSEDCDPDAMVSMSALTSCASRPEEPEAWAWQAGCLDHMATASCADLEGPDARYGNAGCLMVDAWPR